MVMKNVELKKEGNEYEECEEDAWKKMKER